MTHHCAFPGCPLDATGIFCPDHYIALPPRQAKFLVGWQIRMMRCDDADTKQHMREALHGYTQEAVRTLQNCGAKASQAAPERARHPSPTAVAGANSTQAAKHG